MTYRMLAALLIALTLIPGTAAVFAETAPWDYEEYRSSPHWLLLSSPEAEMTDYPREGTILLNVAVGDLPHRFSELDALEFVDVVCLDAEGNTIPGSLSLQDNILAWRPTEPLAPLSFYSFGYHFRNLDMQEAWGADERYISPDVQGSIDIFTRSELTQPVSADAFTLDIELSRTHVWCDEEPVLSGVATIGLSETFDPSLRPFILADVAFNGAVWAYRQPLTKEGSLTFHLWEIPDDTTCVDITLHNQLTDTRTQLPPICKRHTREDIIASNTEQHCQEYGSDGWEGSQGADVYGADDGYLANNSDEKPSGGCSALSTHSNAPTGPLTWAGALLGLALVWRQRRSVRAA